MSESCTHTYKDQHQEFECTVLACDITRDMYYIKDADGDNGWCSGCYLNID